MLGKLVGLVAVVYGFFLLINGSPFDIVSGGAIFCGLALILIPRRK